MTAGQAWIVVHESGRGVAPYTAARSIVRDEPVTIGRAAMIALGVEVSDDGISRHALTVTSTADGWMIEDLSRNGAVLHPWGLPVERLRPAVQLDWPLVGIRLLGTQEGTHHWVLLERDDHPISRAGAAVRHGTTMSGSTPPPVTALEQETLQLVFESLLAWPPPLVPEDPLLLKQAARRLGVGLGAVRTRLENVRGKAYRLGLNRTVSATDPAYLHVLVGAGYVLPPAVRVGPGAPRLR